MRNANHSNRVARWAAIGALTVVPVFSAGAGEPALAPTGAQADATRAWLMRNMDEQPVALRIALQGDAALRRIRDAIRLRRIGLPQPSADVVAGGVARAPQQG